MTVLRVQDSDPDFSSAFLTERAGWGFLTPQQGVRVVSHIRREEALPIELGGRAFGAYVLREDHLDVWWRVFAALGEEYSYLGAVKKR